MEKPTRQLAQLLVLATALIAAVTAALLPPRLLAQPQAPSKGMDPKLLAKANAGDAYSQYLVAYAYDKGVGVPKDPVQADKWYRKAAEAGYPRAMARLGAMYALGRGGLPKDDVQAVIWFRKAAEAGQALAMSNLGHMYAAGRGGLAQDESEAVIWYRKAAEAGDAFGMTDLGDMYAAGRGGLAQDDSQAVIWYRKAAEFDNVRGMTDLGDMYAAGRGGLAKDDVEAVNWFRQAAEAGDASGMFKLGVMYITGRGGLKQDKAQAVSWFTKAAQLGDSNAQRALVQMAQVSIACIGREGLASQLTPVELYKDASSCIDQERYDDGLFLYSVAGAYGRFDILRVKDATAHDVAVLLPGIIFRPLDKRKLAAFQERVKQLSGNDTLRGKYCLDLKNISPPQYFPIYMISHGMVATANAMGFTLQGTNPGDNPLVSPFDAAKAWKQAVDEFLQCQNAASH